MIRLHLLICVFLLGFLEAGAQMHADNSSRDLGTIYNYNNDTAYFYITNTGSQKVFFLPVQPREDYQVFCDTKTIAPGEMMTIGIIYYTDRKGKFSIDVPLYFSNDAKPMVLKVSGQIKSISPNALTVCPSIENSKPLDHTVPFSIIVRDGKTNVQIKEARVTVEQGKKISNCVPGYRSMAFQCNCKYGKLLVGASSEGYMPASKDFYFDAENNTCIIYLDKQVVDTSLRIIEKKKTIVIQDTVHEEIIVYKPAGNTNDFNSTQYKPNHLVFVIDVSGSMKDSVKLEYLKTSMKALIAVLRPQDHITLITYASKPKVVFENVNGVSKNILYATIDSLHAKGGSVGSDALNMAYDMARQHFITDGNNQIFLATDGLFNGSNVDEKDLYRMAKREYTQNGVKLTTIAFGRNEKAKLFLKELALKGNGQSLSIVHLPADQDVLIEEVKAQSLK